MIYSPVMLFWCSTETQLFVHNKSRSTSQFTKSKSRDLQKLLRYLSGIVSLTFYVKDSTGGCTGWSAFPGFLGFGILSGVYPTIFDFYSNDLPCEALSLTSTSKILPL